MFVDASACAAEGKRITLKADGIKTGEAYERILAAAGLRYYIPDDPPPALFITAEAPSPPP